MATMDAILATIVASGWAHFWSDVELGRIKLITCLINNFTLNLLRAASANPSDVLSLHWIKRIH